MWAAPLVLCVYAISLTQSRGALLALLAGVSVLLIARYGWRTAALLGVVVVPALLFLLAGRQTDLSTGGGTAQDRIQIWSDAVMAWRDAPLFGVGRDVFGQQEGFVAHNSYLQCFVELGLFGGMLFLGAFYLAAAQLVRLGDRRKHVAARPGDGPAAPLRLRRRRRLGGRHGVADPVLHHPDLHGAGPGDGVHAHGPRQARRWRRRASTCACSAGCWPSPPWASRSSTSPSACWPCADGRAARRVLQLMAGRQGDFMRISEPKRGRLRVAHVTLGLDVGGQEKLLVEFAHCADRRRFDLHFVSLGGRGVLAGDLEAWGWPVEALGEPSGFRPGLVLRLARFFRDRRIDVVHTHDERPHIYGAFAARLAGVRRLVHTRHHGMAFRLTPRQAGLVRLAARLTDRFVCVSADSAGQAVRHGVSPRAVRVLHNGIDLTRFAPAAFRGDGPVVTVARLSPEKDIDTLLKATALAAGEDADFRLEIAGDGPCMADLRRTAAELGLDNRVTFLGAVRDVPALLARAGLFVLPSRTEGVSLTLLEAMATGLAVVATQVGGNPEVVADGETGLLVPPGDPAALAAAMLRLRGNEWERRRMGQAGRRRVERRFDVRRMTAEYERLYLGLDDAAGRLRAGVNVLAGANAG